MLHTTASWHPQKKRLVAKLNLTIKLGTAAKVDALANGAVVECPQAVKKKQNGLEDDFVKVPRKYRACVGDGINSKRLKIVPIAWFQ